MTRHGKNCTAGAVYTYHEKKKDTAASGYGTQRVRLGRDAVKDFDCCCLSLQPCRDPVVTPQGFLYEREAIVGYLLHRKTQIQRQSKLFQRQQRRREQQQRGRGGPEGEGPSAAAGPAPPGPLPSFWIPSLTPEAAAEEPQKPDPVLRCPMSGRRLRLRDLVRVRWVPAQRGLSRAELLARGEGQRYVCAVTGDALSNGTACAVLRPSGSVVTLDCVERLIRKDMRDPLTGDPLSDSDIIVLQRGGTGFAGAGTCLEAKKSRPVMQA
ncbi:nitric oxide synthase-interacting protein [Patagioenas fasciata]|uniref:nitric oxide synthase-interacting protein n=1 Tax=Patagioenas fasciata TaxID=372321 RepID=UPI003A99D11C